MKLSMQILDFYSTPYLDVQSIEKNFIFDLGLF